MSKMKTVILSGLLLLGPFGVISTHTVQAEGLSFGFGGIAVIAPKYEGSKEHKVIGFPLVIPYSASSAETSSFGSRISFKGLDDVRLNLLSNETIELGPVAGYRGGRKQSDGNLLGGLGDIDGGVVLGAFGAVNLRGFTFDASYADQLSGTKTGGQIKLGASTKIELSPTLKFTAGVGTTYSSDDYMDNFFGVSSAQTASSSAGLATYNPSAGFKDVNFSVGSDIAIGSNWTMKLGGRYSRLIGDAGNSPVVESKDQFTGTVGLIFKLGE